MNTPITEAQYQLAHEIRQSSYQEKAAQLIADSEARAIAPQLEVVAVLTRLWLNVDEERDQLRADLAAERKKVRLLRKALENVKDSICRNIPDGYSQPCVDQSADECDKIIDAALKEGAK